MENDRIKLVEICRNLAGKYYERYATYADGSTIMFNSAIDAKAYGDTLVNEPYNNTASYYLADSSGYRYC